MTEPPGDPLVDDLRLRGLPPAPVADSFSDGSAGLRRRHLSHRFRVSAKLEDSGDVNRRMLGERYIFSEVYGERQYYDDEEELLRELDADARFQPVFRPPNLGEESDKMVRPSDRSSDLADEMAACELFRTGRTVPVFDPETHTNYVPVIPYSDDIVKKFKTSAGGTILENIEMEPCLAKAGLTTVGHFPPGFTSTTLCRVRGKRLDGENSAHFTWHSYPYPIHMHDYQRYQLTLANPKERYFMGSPAEMANAIGTPLLLETDEHAPYAFRYAKPHFSLVEAILTVIKTERFDSPDWSCYSKERITPIIAEDFLFNVQPRLLIDQMASIMLVAQVTRNAIQSLTDWRARMGSAKGRNLAHELFLVQLRGLYDTTRATMIAFMHENGRARRSAILETVVEPHRLYLRHSMVALFHNVLVLPFVPTDKPTGMVWPSITYAAWSDLSLLGGKSFSGLAHHHVLKRLQQCFSAKMACIMGWFDERLDGHYRANAWCTAEASRAHLEAALYEMREALCTDEELQGYECVEHATAMPDFTLVRKQQIAHSVQRFNWKTHSAEEMSLPAHKVVDWATERVGGAPKSLDPMQTLAGRLGERASGTSGELVGPPLQPLRRVASYAHHIRTLWEEHLTVLTDAQRRGRLDTMVGFAHPVRRTTKVADTGAMGDTRGYEEVQFYYRIDNDMPLVNLPHDSMFDIEACMTESTLAKARKAGFDSDRHTGVKFLADPKAEDFFWRMAVERSLPDARAKIEADRAQAEKFLSNYNKKDRMMVADWVHMYIVRLEPTYLAPYTIQLGNLTELRGVQIVFDRYLRTTPIPGHSPQLCNKHSWRRALFEHIDEPGYFDSQKISAIERSLIREGRPKLGRDAGEMADVLAQLDALEVGPHAQRGSWASRGFRLDTAGPSTETSQPVSQGEKPGTSAREVVIESDTDEPIVVDVVETEEGELVPQNTAAAAPPTAAGPTQQATGQQTQSAGESSAAVHGQDADEPMPDEQDRDGGEGMLAGLLVDEPPEPPKHYTPATAKPKPAQQTRQQDFAATSQAGGPADASPDRRHSSKRSRKEEKKRRPKADDERRQDDRSEGSGRREDRGRPRRGDGGDPPPPRAPAVLASDDPMNPDCVSYGVVAFVPKDRLVFSRGVPNPDLVPEAHTNDVLQLPLGRRIGNNITLTADNIRQYLSVSLATDGPRAQQTTDAALLASLDKAAKAEKKVAHIAEPHPSNDANWPRLSPEDDVPATLWDEGWGHGPRKASDLEPNTRGRLTANHYVHMFCDERPLLMSEYERKLLSLNMNTTKPFKKCWRQYRAGDTDAALGASNMNAWMSGQKAHDYNPTRAMRTAQAVELVMAAPQFMFMNLDLVVMSSGAPDEASPPRLCFEATGTSDHPDGLTWEAFQSLAKEAELDYFDALKARHLLGLTIDSPSHARAGGVSRLMYRALHFIASRVGPALQVAARRPRSAEKRAAGKEVWATCPAEWIDPAGDFQWHRVLLTFVTDSRLKVFNHTGCGEIQVHNLQTVPQDLAGNFAADVLLPPLQTYRVVADHPLLNARPRPLTALRPTGAELVSAFAGLSVYQRAFIQLQEPEDGFSIPVRCAICQAEPREADVVFHGKGCPLDMWSGKWNASVLAELARQHESDMEQNGAYLAAYDRRNATAHKAETRTYEYGAAFELADNEEELPDADTTAAVLASLKNTAPAVFKHFKQLHDNNKRALETAPKERSLPATIVGMTASPLGVGITQYGAYSSHPALRDRFERYKAFSRAMPWQREDMCVPQSFRQFTRRLAVNTACILRPERSQHVVKHPDDRRALNIRVLSRQHDYAQSAIQQSGQSASRKRGADDRRVKREEEEIGDPAYWIYHEYKYKADFLRTLPADTADLLFVSYQAARRSQDIELRTLVPHERPARMSGSASGTGEEPGVGVVPSTSGSSRRRRHRRARQDKSPLDRTSGANRAPIGDARSIRQASRKDATEQSTSKDSRSSAHHSGAADDLPASSSAAKPEESAAGSSRSILKKKTKSAKRGKREGSTSSRKAPTLDDYDEVARAQEETSKAEASMDVDAPAPGDGPTASGGPSPAPTDQ